MNSAEASTLVTMLVNFYPNIHFDSGNSAAYEAGIADLDARETYEAIDGLVRASGKLPAVSDIRGEVFRARKVARDRGVLNRLPSGAGFPSPQEWAEKLPAMLDASERHATLARRWYAAKGKVVPPDPGAPIVEMVTAGARGDDIRAGLRSVKPEIRGTDG